jgi:TetR/AcrR family transcriptional regulator, tetracycline repressor protein
VAAPPHNPRTRRAPTEAEVLDAALALLDAGGPEAATIRRIAAAVDAAPSVVYTYFPEQAAVHRALVERLLAEVAEGAAADVSDHRAGGAPHWPHVVEVLALRLRERLLAHPGAVALVLGDDLSGPSARALGRRLCELMADAGLGADARRGSFLITTYVLGAIALSADAEQFRWGLRRVLGGIGTRN